MDRQLKHIKVSINTERIFNKERNGKIVITKRLDGLMKDISIIRINMVVILKYI